MGVRTSRDLTTGSIPRHALALAVPAILSTLVHNLYGLNDVYFAKFLGLAGQTAVSSNLFTLITVFGVIQLAYTGTLTLIARRTGAGNEAGANRAARQGLLFALAVSLLTMAAGQLSAPLVPRAMGMAPDVTRESLTYLRVVFWGLPAMFLFPTVEAVFRARGDTRTPLLLQVVAVSANIAGNALAVFVLETGVAGLAVSTIASRVVGALAGWWLLRRGRVGLTLERGDGPRIDLALWSRIVRVSAPLAARTMLFGLVYQFVSGISASFGTPVQNGLGVGIRVEGMCFFILVGFGIAAGPLVGQNLGAMRPDRAARAAWTTVAMAMAPSLLFTAVFYLFPDALMGVFTREARTAAFGADYLRAVSVSMVFMALEVVLANAFAGAGDTLPPMLVDVPLTALRIPSSWLFAQKLGFGPPGIWWSISGTAIARGACMALWFGRNRWKRARPDLD